MNAEMDGTWPNGCVQRAFVQGMKWWQFHANGATAFPSEVDEAEQEAIRRYGEPEVPIAAPPEPGGATELPELSKWDEVERQCLAFLEKPSTPSEVAIAWCVSLVSERREALAGLREYKAKHEAAQREIAELKGKP